MNLARLLVVVAFLTINATNFAFAADAGGKPEKTDVIVTYAQPSGAFTPI